MERPKPKPHGLIIALQVIGSRVLTSLLPSQVKTIIAETIGVRTEDITAQMKMNRRNKERLKRLETQNVTFNWNSGDLQKTTATMIKAPRYEETRRSENPQITPQPPTTNAWTERRSNPARPAGGHPDVGARGRETAPCPGGCPGAGAGSGAAGATETSTQLREITMADFKDKCVKLIQNGIHCRKDKEKSGHAREKSAKTDGKQTLSGRRIYPGQGVCTRLNEKHQPTNRTIPK